MLEFSDGSEHGQHELAANVDLLPTHEQHDQADAAAIEVLHDPRPLRSRIWASIPACWSAGGGVDGLTSHAAR